MSGRIVRLPYASRVRVTAAAVALACAVAVGGDTAGTRTDAEALKQKVAAITAYGDRPSSQTHRTTLTEREVNAYLTYEGGVQLPKGMLDPSVTMLGTGRVSGHAVVD